MKEHTHWLIILWLFLTMIGTCNNETKIKTLEKQVKELNTVKVIDR